MQLSSQQLFQHPEIYFYGEYFLLESADWLGRRMHLNFYKVFWFSGLGSSLDTLSISLFLANAKQCWGAAQSEG